MATRLRRRIENHVYNRENVSCRMGGVFLAGGKVEAFTEAAHTGTGAETAIAPKGVACARGGHVTDVAKRLFAGRALGRTFLKVTPIIRRAIPSFLVFSPHGVAAWP